MTRPSMLPRAFEQTGIQVRVRAVAHGQGMRPVGANSGFNALNSFHDQQAQLPVKNVER